MAERAKKHWLTISVILALLPFIVSIVCLGLGRYALSIPQSIDILNKVLFEGGAGVSPQDYSVVVNVRIPRIALALLSGAGLAVSGAAFQALFSNPLATPDTLGVAYGAAFGAVLGMLIGSNGFVNQVLGLAFGLVAMILTYAISRTQSRSSVVMLVLGGMVVSSMFQAFVSLIKYVADPEDKLPSITYWLMGTLSGASYAALSLSAPLILVGIVALFLLRWRLNVLSLSEDEAKASGTNVKLVRGCVIVAATLITASCVSVCGQVGWVGLLVPHVSRMLFGSNNRMVVPASISLGAVFMLVIDTVARAATPAEIPVSILTATIGAPFFIILLKRTGGAWQ